MAAFRTDVLFCFVYRVFYVKKPLFVVADAVGITLREKDLYHVESVVSSSLWVIKREINYKHSTRHIIPEVKKHFKQIKRNKSESIDKIPNCILRECAHELAPLVSHVINLSLKYAWIPGSLKTAKVTPIYKDDEKSKLQIIDQFRCYQLSPKF